MAFNQRMLEEVAEWCLHCRELEPERLAVFGQFFDDDDPRPIAYWGGTGDRKSKERRFLGYFMLRWRLPSGETPAEVAVNRLYTDTTRDQAMAAVSQSRFAMTAVKTLTRRTVWLELKDEQFQVAYPGWSTTLERDTAIAAHLLPAGHGLWLVGPGWVVMPFKLGPGFKATLDSWQMDPIELERFLQGRTHAEDERPPMPADDDLQAAVARLTDWARQHGYRAFVKQPSVWESLVVKYLQSRDVGSFSREMLARLPARASLADAEELLPLLTNIWNNTPQPDRGGLTPNELGRQQQTRGIPPDLLIDFFQ